MRLIQSWGRGEGGCFWLQKSARRVEQWNGRDSSPLLFGRRGDRRHFPSPHTREGAERRKALRLGLHLAVPRALRARRLAALHLWRLPPRDRARRVWTGGLSSP